jgi:heptosyltransferase II
MKILMIVGGGIGDLLMSTPMFRAIKQEYPKSHLSVLIVQSINAALLVDNPHVDEIIDWKPYEGQILELSRIIRSKGFDYAIHNHSCPRWRFYLVPFLAQIPRRIGFDRRSTGKGLKTKLQRFLLTSEIPYRAKAGLRTQMNLDLLRFLQIEDHDISYDVYLKRSAKRASNRVGIHPGSDGNGAIKRWPATHFLSLAKRLVHEKQQEVVFFLGPAETELKQVIKEEPGIRISEPPSIAALYEGMSTCSAFISNDSGLSHLAASLKLPTVVLFGPTDPTEYILPTHHVNISVQGYDCRLCFKDKKCHVKPPTCMDTITVEQVFNGFEELEADLVENL